MQQNCATAVVDKVLLFAVIFLKKLLPMKIYY